VKIKLLLVVLLVVEDMMSLFKKLIQDNDVYLVLVQVLVLKEYLQ
jgi:hypothetical protein